MPLTLNNIAAELDTRIIPAVNNQLGDQFYRNGVNADKQFLLTRDGLGLVSVPSANGAAIPRGLFTLTFETAAIPSRAHLEPNDGMNIRRVTLHFNGDRSVLPARRPRTKFYFIQRTNVNHIEARKIAEKMVEVYGLYLVGILKMSAKQDQDAKEAKAIQSAEEKLNERKKKLKANEAQRESMYEELQKSLSEAGLGTVESELKSGYMNLKLENNVRVKIAVDADRVFITEIDTPMYFDRASLKNILGYLQKVSAL